MDPNTLSEAGQALATYVIVAILAAGGIGGVLVAWAAINSARAKPTLPPLRQRGPSAYEKMRNIG